MGRTKKLIDFKPLVSVKYHKELHHTCNSSVICREHINPSELCGNCKYYKLAEVDVADDRTGRDIIEWW